MTLSVMADRQKSWNFHREILHRLSKPYDTDSYGGTRDTGKRRLSGGYCRIAEGQAFLPCYWWHFNQHGLHQRGQSDLPFDKRGENLPIASAMENSCGKPTRQYVFLWNGGIVENEANAQAYSGGCLACLLAFNRYPRICHWNCKLQPTPMKEGRICRVCGARLRRHWRAEPRKHRRNILVLVTEIQMKANCSPARFHPAP